ncbi:hypothetical protein NLG97_g7702 [Lecanicillium saksenae]|uniref:Uncharacterized protein n=1 Tax=Lecanicillium saksenae TaxID=468837 RepID=A0ACC1QP94_9HYPO|nr:hypothetical protein NLG97_g7702 [Lecanicillium saksenae]
MWIPPPPTPIPFLSQFQTSLSVGTIVSNLPNPRNGATSPPPSNNSQIFMNFSSLFTSTRPTGPRPEPLLACSPVAHQTTAHFKARPMSSLFPQPEGNALVPPADHFCPHLARFAAHESPPSPVKSHESTPRIGPVSSQTTGLPFGPLFYFAPHLVANLAQLALHTIRVPADEAQYQSKAIIGSPSALGQSISKQSDPYTDPYRLKAASTNRSPKAVTLHHLAQALTVETRVPTSNKCHRNNAFDIGHSILVELSSVIITNIAPAHLFYLASTSFISLKTHLYTSRFPYLYPTSPSMPARVTYFLSDDTLHQHHLHHDSKSSSMMPSATIAVRPPSRVQTQALLSPPIVAKLSSKQCSSGIHFFTTAVLLDGTGNVAEGLLDGTTAATGILLDATTMIFAFPDLSIADVGNYTIRLDVYGMYPESTDGATLIAQLETTEISVHDAPVPSQRPSSTERDMIRLARSAGVPLSPPH